MSIFRDQTKRLVASLVGDLIDAGFDAAAKAVAERRAVPRSPSAEPPPRPEPLQRPDRVGLSRHQCPECKSPVEFVVYKDDEVFFACANPNCSWCVWKTRQEAANREGRAV